MTDISDLAGKMMRVATAALRANGSIIAPMDYKPGLQVYSSEESAQRLDTIADKMTRAALGAALGAMRDALPFGDDNDLSEAWLALLIIALDHQPRSA